MGQTEKWQESSGQWKRKITGVTWWTGSEGCEGGGGTAESIRYTVCFVSWGMGEGRGQWVEGGKCVCQSSTSVDRHVLSSVCVYVMVCGVTKDGGRVPPVVGICVCV